MFVKNGDKYFSHSPGLILDPQFLVPMEFVGSKGQDIQCVTSVMDDPVANHRRIKLVTEDGCKKWRRLLYLLSVLMASSLFMLDMGISRRRSWIPAGGQDIHSVVDGGLINN